MTLVCITIHHTLIYAKVEIAYLGITSVGLLHVDAGKGDKSRPQASNNEVSTEQSANNERNECVGQCIGRHISAY